MKTKLFLTSMLAVLVASPALATLNNGNGVIAGNSIAENCYGDPLTYSNQERTSGTVKYTAKWTPQQCSITLNPDAYHATNNPNGRGATGTSSSPATLYTTYGIGAYLENARTNLMAASPSAANPLTTAPTGKQVTLTLDRDLPNSYIGTAPTVNNQQDDLVFSGFYATAGTSAGAAQYIDATKYITGTGASTAAGLYQSEIDPDTGEALCPETTWYARYGCKTFSVSNLADLDSHTFAGWVDGNADPLTNNQICIDDDTTIYATWTPRTFNIIYEPGTCAGSEDTTTGAGALTFGSNYNIAALSSTNVTVPSGYTFQGWTSSSSATTAGSWAINNSVPAGTNTCTSSAGCSNLGPWGLASNLTLYAVCTGNSQTITYNCGTPANTTVTGPVTASTPVTVGGVYTLAGSNNCSAPGYTFAGWSCPNLGGSPTLPASNPQYYAGGATGTYTYAGNVTCTAQWDPNELNLEWYLDENLTQQYNANSSTCDFGTANDINLVTPAPNANPGYTFDGWEVSGWEQ